MLALKAVLLVLVMVVSGVESAAEDSEPENNEEFLACTHCGVREREDGRKRCKTCRELLYKRVSSLVF